MPKNHLAQPPLPTPADFRIWLSGALSTLEVSAYTLAPSLGLGRNTVAMFLNNDKADIRLSTAKALHVELGRYALKKGEVLPPLGGLDHG